MIVPKPDHRALAITFGLAAIMVLTAPAAMVACTPQVKTAEKDALNTAQTVCVFVNSLLPVPEIQTACGIEQKLAPIVEQLLGEHRAAAKREMAAAKPAGSR